MWGTSTREWESAAAWKEDKSGKKSNVFVCGAAQTPQQGEVSDDQDLWLLLWIYLQLLTHEMVPA